MVSFLLLRAWERKARAGLIRPRGETVRAGILGVAATAASLSLAFGNVHFDDSPPRREM